MFYVPARIPVSTCRRVDVSTCRLVTDDDRFVVMVHPTVSARAQTATVMDGETYRCRAEEIRKAIAAMELDIGKPHIALLINSMYSDERKDDAYQRLQYLRLWQSLAEAGVTCLGYQGDIREDNVVVAGNSTLLQLTRRTARNSPPSSRGPSREPGP